MGKNRLSECVKALILVGRFPYLLRKKQGGDPKPIDAYISHMDCKGLGGLSFGNEQVHSLDVKHVLSGDLPYYAIKATTNTYTVWLYHENTFPTNNDVYAEVSIKNGCSYTHKVGYTNNGKFKSVVFSGGVEATGLDAFVTNGITPGEKAEYNKCLEHLVPKYKALEASVKTFMEKRGNLEEILKK